MVTMSEYYAPAIASITELNAYQLAGLADVHSPDSLESAGAAFLTSIRDSVAEQLEYFADNTSSADNVADLADEFRDSSDECTEIADSAPSIYTFERFKQFTDLCAWQEDISDYAHGESDMEKLAGYALYIIAERLIAALVTEIEDFSL